MSSTLNWDSLKAMLQTNDIEHINLAVAILEDNNQFLEEHAEDLLEIENEYDFKGECTYDCWNVIRKLCWKLDCLSGIPRENKMEGFLNDIITDHAQSG